MEDVVTYVAKTKEASGSFTSAEHHPPSSLDDHEVVNVQPFEAKETSGGGIIFYVLVTCALKDAG